MTTLAPHIDAYLTSRLRLGTYNRKSIDVVKPRLRTLDRHFGRRPLAHLTRRAITRWLESLDRLAVNSRASYLASASTFTRWLTIEGVITVDPCLEVTKPRRPRSVPRAQPEQVIVQVLEACDDERERAIVLLMVGLGLRRQEVAGLRWEHYDEQMAQMLVVATKGGDERFLPVPQLVADALRPLRVRSTGPVIRSKVDGAHVQPAYVGRLVSQAMARAGVKQAPYDGVSGHALRHTAASDVLDVSGDLRVVQQMLGHARLSSTAIYLRRASAEQLRDAMEGRSYRRSA